MRVHGTLVKWNDERGFGFIQPTVGTEELFVHISAFPRDGSRPRIGEMISFEVELRDDGKKLAVRLMRPGGRVPSHRRLDHRRPTPTRKRPTTGALGWLALLSLSVIGYVGYTKLTSHRSANDSSADRSLSASAPRAAAIPREVTAAPFHCDGRKYCSQMTSCAEATYFVKQCPTTQMDGDGDGVPCESQWCKGVWSN